MAKFFERMMNSFGFKSENQVQQEVQRVFQEQAPQRLQSFGPSIYEQLEQESSKRMSDKYAEIRSLDDDLTKSQAIISGAFQGYMSGHTKNPVLASWIKGISNPDQEIAAVIGSIRAKASDLYKNDAIINRYVKGLVNNVVGTGFIVDLNINDSQGELDQGLSDYVYGEWKDQCKRGNFEITKRLSIEDVQRVHFTEAPVAGEILMRIIRDDSVNRHGWTTQMLDIDRLDLTMNKNLANGSLIVMGVECNKWGQPIAYHLKTGFNANEKHERVPASDIIHAFIQEFPEQRRAITWFHAAMMDAKQMAAFTESVIFASRWAAQTLMTIETQPSNMQNYASGRDANGKMYKQVDQGQIMVMAPGDSLKPYTAPFPSNSIEPMFKTMNRRIATATTSSYSTLTSDYSDSNFSASRLGVNEERSDWETKQQWYITNVLEVMFTDWLIHKLSKGQLKYKGKTLGLDMLDKLNVPKFRGRNWGFIDPTKDMEVMKEALDIGAVSIDEVARTMFGTDASQVIAANKKLYEECMTNDVPIMTFIEQAEARSRTRYNIMMADAEKSKSETSKLVAEAKITELNKPQPTNQPDTQPAQRSLDIEFLDKLLETTTRAVQPNQITVENVVKPKGYKVIKTPILDNDGLVVRVEEEVVEDGIN